ncbi:MAG: DUF5067 domain-containing protein [Clostridiaceae bacterium]|nr:DUF5067 domain-containing protein [Clostridiaceae bacterium]
MKKKLCVLTMAAAVLLTACGPEIPELSNEDNSTAAQYVAGALLKYDKNYDDSLDYDHSVLETTPTPEPTATPAPTAQANEQDTDTDADTGDGASVEETRKSVTLSELYGIAGVKIKQVTYQVKKSYGTSVAVCTPSKGKKLVVVQFNITNTSSSSKKVDLSKKNVQTELLVDGESQGSALLSIVDGDMQFFKEKIKAGAHRQGVLLFEVDKAVKMDNVQVSFVNGQKEALVSVQ